MRTSLKLADAGRDGIGNLIVGDEFVDDRAGAVHGFARVGIEQHRTALDRDFADGFESEIVSVNVKGFQGGSQFSVLRCSV